MKMKNNKYENIKECPEIGYFIGSIWGDGCAYLHKHKYKCLRLSVTDKNFSDYFRNVIFKITGVFPSQRYYKRKKIILTPKKTYKYLSKKFVIKIKSNALYDLIKDKKRCLKYIKKYPQQFLRGMFDAEGCVFLNNKKHPRVTFVNKDKKIIDLVDILLKKFKIEYTVGKNCQRMYIIRISQNSRKLFLKKIDFRINRKHQRLIGNTEYFPSEKYKMAEVVVNG